MSVRLVTEAPVVTTAGNVAQITIRFEQVADSVEHDELMAFPFGFEVSAARNLEKDGHLPTAKIGRRRYAKRSDVLALIDKLGPATAPLSKVREDPYAKLVAIVKRKKR
jgi:hypothetical protein